MNCLGASLLLLLATGVGGAQYGVDCSFPIHSKELSCGDLLGDRESFYEDYMQGCRDYFGKKAFRCDQTEDDRIEMSRRQPQSMVNYTSTGFKKIRAPKAVMDLLLQHWNANQDKKEAEQWGIGNVYTNNWASPTYMVSVENQRLRGGGYNLKNQIWDAARSTIEEWTGMELQPTSMYGIRVYTEGAVLSPHVDRLPLVSSAIVNVAQDVDEPWLLEVYDRNNQAVNVTMEPGDMVLYESGSLLHGRPFPLKGRYYANIFIHFEPTGRPLADETDNYLNEIDGFLPPYLMPDSPEASHWAATHPHGWKKPVPSSPIQQVFSPVGHRAAALGDVDALAQLAKTDKRSLRAKDKNGWEPLHEAVRGGHLEAVELLIKNGASKDARIGSDGKGISALQLALDHHSEDHPVAKYLLGIGAAQISEEL